MVIKTKEPAASTIATLESLRIQPGVSPYQRALIGEEISNIRAGERGELEAAYFIDFELGASRNYAVIHDLRIEHDGRVAQIDHLIVNRTAEIILIESKNVSTALRSNDRAEFEVKTRYGWKGMNSPLEQNRRHALVLAGFLNASGLLPRRLGFQLRPDLHQWVLVPAQCALGKTRDRTQIVKMDMFGTRMKEWIARDSSGDVLRLAKCISSKTLRDFAAAVAQQHRPVVFDYAAKFQIISTTSGDTTDTVRSVRRAPAVSAQTKNVSAAVRTALLECATCGIEVETKVTTFCRLNAMRFGGGIYCRTCQSAVVRCCDECALPLDSKTSAFCRFNSRRFGKRLLCRECQTATTGAGAGFHNA